MNTGAPPSPTKSLSAILQHNQSINQRVYITKASNSPPPYPSCFTPPSAAASTTAAAAEAAAAAAATGAGGGGVRVISIPNVSLAKPGMCAARRASFLLFSCWGVFVCLGLLGGRLG